METKIEKVLTSFIAGLSLRRSTEEVTKEAIEKLKQLYIETQNCALEYDNDKMCGTIAKEYGQAVGEVGCPHCGVGHHGAIGRICNWCDADMFSKDSRSLYRIFYDQAESRPPQIRLGQSIYNFAYSMFPIETSQLNATEVDCFHRDDKINDFIENLIFLINHSNIQDGKSNVKS